MSGERALVLLPTHVFPIRHPHRAVYVVLDPVLFTGPDGTFRTHKAKLVYLVAVAEEFARRRPSVTVVYPDDADALYSSLADADADAYPPLDRYIEAKFRESMPRLRYLRHPGFVLDPEGYGGPLKLTQVFGAARRAAGIMPGELRSTDRENRHPPDRHLLRAASPPRQAATPAMRRAIDYVRKRFPEHHGEADGAGYYPATRRAALKRLREYAASGLGLMRYQDAIVRAEPFLGHSVLSAAMNVGLLDPREVCREVENSGHSHSDKEGFVRQVLGWRELMRLHYARETHSAYTRYDRPSEPWYLGTTGLDPVDDVIGSCARTAYAHHINRLMVVLNAFTLTGHSDGSVYRWFMEMVAIDAYDWVMVSNISIMRHRQHKPYISSSAYIERMSTGFEEGGWKRRWDALFYSHVRRRNVAYFKRALEGRKYRDAERTWRSLARDALEELAPGNSP